MVEWRAMRPIRVRIDSAALRHNLDAARRRAPRSRICAVVKANAYGHGLARAARALAAAEGLALIELEAALELRRSGEKRPILLLQGFFSPEELEPIAAHDLTTVVHDAEQLAMLERARLPKRIAVVAKLNTGMNRLGFPAEDLRGVLDRLRDCPGAHAIALMTHFADAYPRHAPTGTPILVAGKRTRTVGRVAMDTLFADLTGIPEAAVGSPATLWGEGLPADEVAASAGTVSYELLCALSQRVPVSEAP